MEIVVSIALMGTAGVGILGAMAASARGSSVNKSQAAALVWLQSAADYVSSITYVPDVPCAADPLPVYQAQLPLAPASTQGWPQANLQITGIQFWNGTAFTPTCDPRYAIEQITLKATNGQGTLSKTLVIVKSKTSV